jgi:hypothetical protein
MGIHQCLLSHSLILEHLGQSFFFKAHRGNEVYSRAVFLIKCYHPEVLFSDPEFSGTPNLINLHFVGHFWSKPAFFKQQDHQDY